MMMHNLAVTKLQRQVNANYVLFFFNIFSIILYILILLAYILKFFVIFVIFFLNFLFFIDWSDVRRLPWNAGDTGYKSSTVFSPGSGTPAIATAAWNRGCGTEGTTRDGGARRTPPTNSAGQQTAAGKYNTKANGESECNRVYGKATVD